MEKKSPIKAKPLRYPGESLDQEILRLQDDILFKYLVYAIFFFTVASLEWIRYASNAPPNPWLYTVVALVVLVYTTIKVVQIRKQIRLLKLGRDGERAVGEYLEKLRAIGYAVFHDIVGEDFNIDHVILAPTGIFTVETKTYSKPARGKSEILFDGQKVLVNDIEVGRNPLIQGRAQASWLSQILEESTGKSFRVQSVVVFPGWFVETVGSGKNSDVWVLNPKALPTYIENAKGKLIQADLNLISFHLSRYIRTLGGQ